MKKPLSKRHELVVNMPYVLLKLLIERNVLDTYIGATLLFRADEPIKEFIARTKKIDILVASFTWCYTKKGWSFWNEINDEYERRLKIASI